MRRASAELADAGLLDQLLGLHGGGWWRERAGGQWLTLTRSSNRKILFGATARFHKNPQKMISVITNRFHKNPPKMISVLTYHGGVYELLVAVNASFPLQS